MAWNIDTSHTRALFAVRHMMISTVRGQFDKVTGTVDFNQANPELSSVEVSIDAASFDTKDAQRDGHLRSPDFLNVEAYPAITFKSTQVEKTGDTTGRITGDLTIRDITRPVVLEAEFNGVAKAPWGATSAGFTATTKINRKDFGLVWNVALETGGVLVGEDVTITLEVEIVQAA